MNHAVKLGDWQTGAMEDGETWLILEAADSAGNVARCSLWVIVDNEGEGDGGREEARAEGPDGGGSGLGAGSVYVGSQTGLVYRFDEDLVLQDSFRIADSSSRAYVTAILSLGDSLLIADAMSHGILKSGPRGGNRRLLVSNLGLPSGLCQDEDGNIWVCDRGQSRIAKYSPQAGLLFTRGGPEDDSVARLSNPEAIATSSGLVYVADTRNNRIAIWDTAGTYLADIRGDFTSPQAVAVTDSGQVYITDKSEGTVIGLNSIGGRFYTIAATYDTTPLSHLCLSEEQHHLYSLLPRRNRVLKYRIMSDDTVPGGGQQGGATQLPARYVLYQPWPNPALRRPNIKYGLPLPTEVSVAIYDITGRVTRTLVNEPQSPGWYSLSWDRKDDRGRQAAAGVYFLRLHTVDYQDQKKLVLAK